jgi:outer membrane lipoprotein-sorting protein
MAVRLEGSLVAVVFATSMLAGPARADAAGDDAVAAMDAAINRATTLVFDYQISNQEAGKSERALAMKARMMGPKRLYEFTAPADMNGIKFLILSPTQIYVYLPAFGKVRRVASHTKNQGFFGLAFSQDDLAVTSYGAQYVGQIASQTPTQYVLVLTAKAQDPIYAKIEITLAKDRMLPLQLKYFNSEGVNVKTEMRSNYSCTGPVCVPGETKMVDNVNGNWTRLVRKTWQHDVAISDDVFSERTLAPQ